MRGSRKPASKSDGSRSRMMVLANRVKSLWAQAIRFDNIQDDSKAVVVKFSDANPFVQEYQQAMANLFQARQQFSASLA